MCRLRSMTSAYCRLQQDSCVHCQSWPASLNTMVCMGSFRSKNIDYREMVREKSPMCILDHSSWHSMIFAKRLPLSK